MKISLPGRRSGDLQDRRGQSAGGMGGGSLPISMLPMLLKGGSPIGILVLLALFVLPQLCSSGNGGFGGITNPAVPAVQPGGAGIPPENDPDADLVAFVDAVQANVQDTWASAFSQAGQRYERAKLTLFTDATQSGCGFAESATGPFYCPADQTVYIDLGFFRELASRFDAPGDFAQAYVIAHELGHHVQNLQGTSGDVQRESQKHPNDANELSVRLELQADCLAGVWGFSAFEQNLLESGDLEEALAATSAVGDDRLQRQATGRVNPDSFTHGSSEQRMKWFKRGYENGDPGSCDTFSGGI